MFALPLLPELMIQRLAWVLVHFIWQGTAVALVLGLTIWLGKLRRPPTRYALSLLALLAMAICPIATFFLVEIPPEKVSTTIESQQVEPRLANSDSETPPSDALLNGAMRKNSRWGNGPFGSLSHNENSPPAPPTIEPVLKPSSLIDGSLDQEETSSPEHSQSAAHSIWQRTQHWIVAVWLVGVALLSLRLLLGWIGVRRLRRQVSPIPQWIIERTRHLAASVHVSAPCIQLSQRITEAIAIGFLKPMILLPITWATELPPDMLDAVIAHELAHIRRGDLWINLLQRLMETLFFYHPAIWWLSRWMRVERELCCDDLVVSVTQNRLRYAETLEHIGRLSLTGTKSMLVVSILGPRAVLLDRIRHILNIQPRDPSSNAWLAGVLPLLIASLIWWSATSMSVVRGAPDPAAVRGSPDPAVVRGSPDPAPTPTAGLPKPVVRGSPDPAPTPTAGLPKPPAAPNNADTHRSNATRDLRSDERRGQETRAEQGDERRGQETRAEQEPPPNAVQGQEPRTPLGDKLNAPAVPTVTGTVVGIDGKPVSGIQVVAFEGTKQLPQTFVTDKQGQVRIPKEWRDAEHFLCLIARDVKEGQEKLGWIDFFMQRHSSNGQKSEDGSFQIVLLPVNRTARGQITDEKGQPLAKIPIVVEYLQHETNFAATHWDNRRIGKEKLIAGTTTDEAGKYELKLPVDSMARVRAIHPDWTYQRISIAKDKTEFPTTKLVKAAKIKGIVTWRGMPVTGVLIGAQALKPDMQHGGWGDGVTNEKGEYQIGGLPTGRFNVLLLEGAKKPLTAAAYDGLDVKQGETASANFALRIGRRVIGRVLDEKTDEPLAGCTVGYYGPARPQSGGAIMSMATNERGEFEFAVPPGKSHFYIAENRDSVPNSEVDIDIPADRDPDPIVLKAGPKSEQEMKIFVGPPLDRKVSLNAQRAPLEAALKAVCDDAGVKLDLDREGLKSVGNTRNMPVVLQLNNVRLGDALSKILDQYPKISFILEEDRVFISIIRKIEARKRALDQPNLNDPPPKPATFPPEAPEAFKKTGTSRSDVNAVVRGSPDPAAVRGSPDPAPTPTAGLPKPVVRGSPDPAPTPTAGLPKPPAAPNTADPRRSNATGDLRSDERRGQETRAEQGDERRGQETRAEQGRTPGPFRGTVRNNSGQPVPLAEIVLCQIRTIDGRDTTDFIATGKADAKGRYVMTLPEHVSKQWLPTSRAAVWAMAKGYGPGVIQFAQGSQIVPAADWDEVDLAHDQNQLPPPVPGTDVDEDQFAEARLYPERTVELELSDEKGLPLQGEVQWLELEQIQIPPAFLKQMIAGPFQGKLTIQHMPSGPNEGSPTNRTLRIKTQTHGTLEFWWNADRASELAGRVREGVTPIKLTAQPVVRIAGRLVAHQGSLPKELIANVSIRLESFHGDETLHTPWVRGFAIAKTDAEGRFEIPQITAGKLGSLRADLPPGAHWRPLISNRREVSFKPGKPTELEIPLIATRTLRGLVRTETGEGIPGIGFNLSFGGLVTQKVSDDLSMTNSAYSETILTDAAGRFAVEIIPGEISLYKQYVAGDGTGTPDLWPDAEKKIPEWLPGNHLRIPASPEPFDLPDIKVTTLRGVLQDETGRPVEAMLVASAGENRAALGMVKTKPDGTFAMEVLGTPKTWKAAREDERGDFGLPNDKAPDVVVVSKSPLVLKIKPNAQPKAPVVPGAIELEAQEESLKTSAFDIRTMQTISWSRSVATESVLHLDREFQDFGCGDLMWLGNTRQLIGLRGARLVPFDIDDLEDTDDISLPELRKLLARQGKSAVWLSTRQEAAIAVESREGHLLLIRIVQFKKASLVVVMKRLTTNQDISFEKPSDGLDQAAWGPIVDGLQAGIVFRTSEKNANKAVYSLGELVQVKVFVRNAGKQVKTYSWRRQSDHQDFPTLIPLLDVWRPLILTQDGRRVPTGMRKIHDAGQRKIATLQPGEAVLVGATSFTLWPSIEVGFGVWPNRQTSIAALPGQYRLSTELPTELAGHSAIHTGEISLQVTEPDQALSARLKMLDNLARLTRINNDDMIGWRDFKTKKEIRPGAPLNPADVQKIRGRVFDAETKKPIAGAVAKVMLFARGDQSEDHLCGYDVITNADGSFEMQIPQSLLSGFKPDWQSDFRVHVTHPQYSEMFQTESLDRLKEIGLVAKDGSVQEASPPPELGPTLDLNKFAAFQAIGLKPGRTLSGRLLDVDNKPLANVHIYGSNSQGWPILPAVPKTDYEGRFRFTIPAKVTVKLEFRTGLAGRTFVTAKPDQTDLGDIRTIPGVKVRGQVFDAHGKPIAHISVTTPAWPDETSQPNFVYRTNAQGWFESDLLAPGTYQVKVGGISPPEDQGKPVISLPPPDLYLPLTFVIKAGEMTPELTLRPAKSTQIKATLITTVPKPAEGEQAQAIDPLYWRAVQKKAQREREKFSAEKKANANRPGKPVSLEVDETSGEVVITGDLQEQQDFALTWVLGFSRLPTLTVKGKLGTETWTRTPNFSEFDADAEPPVYRVKAPTGLSDVTLEPQDYVQHVQFGSGPKLFGKSIHRDQLGAADLDLKIYRYRPTTLKVTFLDAAGKSIEMPDNTLPNGLEVKAHYSREEEVRQAGGRFESSEALMNRSILDHAVLHFVIPGEVIELTIAQPEGKPVTRQMTLKDGETRTIQVQLGKDQNWTEKSEPTPRLVAPKG